MCKKDSNPQPSHSISTQAIYIEPWMWAVKSVQWCPMMSKPNSLLCHELVRATVPLWLLWLLPVLVSLIHHPWSSKEFGLRPNCPWVLLRKHFSSLALGNTVRVLSLFQLLQLALCLSSVLFCFKVLWIQVVWRCIQELRSAVADSTQTQECMTFGQGHSNHHQGGLHKLYVRADVWLLEFPKHQNELGWLPCMGRYSTLVHLISISRQGLSCCRPVCRS